MKAIYLLCFFFLSVNAVINQEAQKREAPAFPQKDYGPPRQQPVAPMVDQRHRRIQAMQRLIQAMRNGGYSGQGRIANRPKPIPIQNSYGPPVQAPQNTYGAPTGGYSSSSGSLAAFTHNHNPDVRCDGWIPIPGPSISSSSGAASSGGHVDTSYGPPKHSSGGSLSTLIVVPEDASFATQSGGASIDTSYGAPVQPQNSYGPPNSFSSSSGSASHSNSIDSSYGAPVQPQNSYGPPNSFSSSGGSASHSNSIDTSYRAPVQPQNSYGPPNSFSSSGGSASHSNSIDSSYGAPIQPQNSYGQPNSFSSGSASSSHNFGAIDTSYGVPEPPVNPQSSYGLPAENGHSLSTSGIETGVASHINEPDTSYGPPIIVGSGHASSASAIASIDNSYGPPVVPIVQPAPVIENNYLPPQFEINSGHASSGHSVDTSYIGPAPIGHETYGLPQNPTDFGPPESSYGPPPSGAVDFPKHSSAGNVESIQTIPSLPTEIQLPVADSGAHFDNAIGLVSSTLGVSAGNSEVIQSHAIHESHTSEHVANVNVNSLSSGSGVSASDSYSAPPLDSYAPGKYAPSFLSRRPSIQTPPARQRPQISPQRPPIAPQRPYVPPVPTKIIRPQLPPPSFRPISQNGHAHSVAHSYSSQSHSQALQHAPPRPIRPLIHRQPVPQGLIQSIGQNVQAQDSHRGLSAGPNTYLPPPTHDVPIPPMRLMLPSSGPVQPFQSHSHGSGVATSSSSFSLQNQDLRHVHVIHDCGKGPQLSQNYGTPLAAPLTSYQSPNSGDSHSAVLSTSYETPSQALEVPQHGSINFNGNHAPSNSYGPPESGLDVVGLESRANAQITELHTSESKVSSQSQLPGLSSGLNGSGLDFVSAIKSHTIEVPQSQAAASNIQFHIQHSHSGHSENRIDGADHQQILADGLLQSILSAVEHQPAQTVPQVIDDAQLDHSEAKTFLKSREGQNVLGDKTKADAKTK